MKIKIEIEKDGKDEKDMPDQMDEELTPEQIAEMAKKLKGRTALTRAERTLLADYLLQEKED